MNRQFERLTLLLLTVLVTGTVHAATWTWMGTSGAGWATATNWNPATIPGIGAHGGSMVTVTIPAGSSINQNSTPNFGTLTTTGTGTVNITGTGTLTVLTAIIATATLNISAPLGGNFTTAGTVVLSGNNTLGSATVNSGTLQATSSTALANGQIELNGGALILGGASTVTSSAFVLVNMNSTLFTQGGAADSMDTVDVPGGVTLTVSSAGGSSLSIAGDEFATGLTGGGAVNGAVNIASSGYLTPGDSGAGTLTVTSLTLTGSPQLNYTVGSSTALVSITGGLVVNGTVNITDGGLTAGTYVLIQGTAPFTAGNVKLGTAPTTDFYYGLSVTGAQLILTVVGPTAVGMAARDAVSDGHASYVTWQTGFETRNLGYHVYRQDGSFRTLLSPGLIAGSGLRATADLKVGRTYVWPDRAAPFGGTYWIESIDMNGKTEMFGPVSTHTGQVPKTLSSPLLADFGRPSALAIQDRTVVHVTAGSPPSVAGSLNQQWVNAAGPAAKVLVRDSGVYRVSAEQLFASGISPGVEVSDLRLWTSGAPVTFRTVTMDGSHLQMGDTLEFYGRGIDTRYSDTRVYWVTLNSGGQQLLTTETPTALSESGNSFIETIQIRQELYYFSGVKNGTAQKFFGPQVASTGLTRIFPTPALDYLSSEPAALEVAVESLTSGPHAISVTLNGLLLGTLTGVNSTLMMKSFAVPVGQLIAGNNTVVLASQSATDVDVESYQQLSYPRRYLNTGAPLQFTASGGSSVHLDGFASGTTRVFDITIPEAAIELHVSADPASPSGSFVNVPFSNEERTLYAFAVGDELSPLDVQRNVPSAWHAFGGAKLVLIGHASLLPAVQPLVQQRQNEGLTVATIDVQDLYDEFSYGEKDAGAIRAFLQFASQHWVEPPQYVLLVGGATFDPRDYLNNPGLDLVPTNFVQTAFLETGSDGAFVNFPVPRSQGLAIGRWPVTSAVDAALVMNKTLGRLPLTRTSSMLLVRDRDDTTSFSQALATVRAAVSAWPAQQIARGSGTDTAVHAQVIAAMQTGPAVLDYQGHGAEDFEDGNILSDSDTAALANTGRSLVFSAPTCFNGYFVDIGRQDLATALLLTEDGGAWAAWASSGETSPIEQPKLSSDLLKAVVVDGLTLGEASVIAKAAITDPDVLSTFHLFGDPSARMSPDRLGVLSTPTAVQSVATTGCGVPGSVTLAVLPFVALALLLSTRSRRMNAVRSRRR